MTIRTHISSKKAKMQGILGIVILIISIIALGLYTGSQPGRTPMLNWQTQESIKENAASQSSRFEMTGNAARITGNAMGIAGNAIGVTGDAVGIAGLAGNAAGITGNTVRMAGSADDAAPEEEAVGMEAEVTGAFTGMGGVTGMAERC